MADKKDSQHSRDLEKRYHYGVKKTEPTADEILKRAQELADEENASGQRRED